MSDPYQSAKRRIEQRRERSSEYGKPGPKTGSVRTYRRLSDQFVTPSTFYLSSDLNLDSILGKDRWYGAYFLNLIRWRKITWRADANGFSRLLYSLLKRVIPPKVLKSIKRKLIAAGVVLCDGTTGEGKSYGYKIDDRYSDTRPIVCEDATLNRRISEIARERDTRLLPVHHHLKDWLSQITFDMERAEPIIRKLTPEDKEADLIDHRKSRREYCTHIDQNDLWFIVDEYGRVHTPLTALENKLNGCVSVLVNGIALPLGEIDLANSQPLLFCLLSRQFLSSPKSQHNLIHRKFIDGNNPYHANNQAISQPTTNTIHPPMRIKRNYPSLSIDSVRELGKSRPGCNLEESMAICEAGLFYESLMTDKEKGKGAIYRERLKEKFYYVLFGRNGGLKFSKKRLKWFRSVMKDRFEKIHPVLSEVLEKLKKKNHEHSSYLLQNFEATIFIHRICGRLMRERPTIPIFTKHDAILTIPEYVSTVEAIIMEEFGKLGVCPTLKRK